MRPFKSVEQQRQRKSVFDLSYSKLLNADMGLLYPVMCDEVVPGDHFSLNTDLVVRCMPLIAPMLHEINIYVHYFFVPYRLLWEDWEDFITGGVDGQDASVLPRMPYPGDCTPSVAYLDSLWCYLGFPKNTQTITATDTMPLDFPRRAYSLIWDEYYRDETLQTEIGTAYRNDILRRAWSKDYFTSALPWSQRGVAPSFPITGHLPIVNRQVLTNYAVLPSNLPGFDHALNIGVSVTPVNNAGVDAAGVTAANAAEATAGFRELNNAAYADLQSAVSFDINDVRLAWQIQKWMERNARGGIRYTEFLRSHFGVAPRDERLQRPEYIGGIKSPLIISEVLQTSENGTTPQGNLAGHGISVARQFAGKYFASEYGLIMGIMSIMPVPMYSQGINRQWLRRTRYDFYFPEFSTLGEQMIEQGELYWMEHDADNKTQFGFQGRYDEMRYKPNLTCGMLAPGEAFDYWTLTRYFSGTPTPPTLDESFILCAPDPRAWAVQYQTNAPQFVVHVGNRIKAVRPIPIMGTPGLVDHH